MKKLLGLVVAVSLLAGTSFGQFLTETETFTQSDGTAVSTLDQWTAPASVIVSNNAAYLPTGTALTNTIGTAVPDQAWTDFDLKPALGVEPTDPATNATTALFYIDADGYVTVYNDGTWVTCSNDVWGSTVTALTGATEKRVSIYQNYDNNEYAVFLAGQLLIQDVPFPKGSEGTYTSFAVQNVDSNATVDDVWIKTTFAGGHATDNDIDLGYASDVAEVHALGYAARTLYVEDGGTPEFSTIAAAVAVARTGDEIKIGASYGTTTENVVLSNGVEYVFSGSAFTTASLTANGDVTFKTDIDTTTLTIAANVTVTGNTGTDVNAGTLTMGTGSLLDITSGTLSETTASIELEGSFTIDGTDWNAGGIAEQGIPMSDDFEKYAANQPIDNYGVYGWSASSSDVKVQTAVKNGGTKALILPDGSAATNLISSSGAADVKVWTTYYLRPALGAEPSDSTETGKSFMSYVNTNGYMVIRENDAWAECAMTLGSSAPYPRAPSKFTESSFQRVAIFQDFSKNEFALFVGNGSSLEIVKERVEFPDAGAPDFREFVIENQDNTAYIDDILITTVTPSGGVDQDGDGTLDTIEIATKGLVMEGGTIFRFI